MTRREVEVALLVAEGMTNREIASRLFVSERTAEYHVEQIRNKLGFRSRSQIASWVATQDLRNAAPPARRAPPVPVTTPRKRRLPGRGVLVASAAGVVVSLGLAAGGFLAFRPASPLTAARIETIAGSGRANGVAGGYSGDFGPASSAQLWEPTDVAVAPDGDIYEAEAFNGVIRRIDPGGTITTVAGGGSRAPATNALATSVSLGYPGAVAVTPRGDVVFDAGSDLYVLRHDSTLEVLASLGEPSGIAVAADGSIYVSDDSADVVWRIKPSGDRAVFAGSGRAGISGDGGSAGAADLNQPHGLAFDGKQRLYLADSASNCLRLIDTITGIITTAAGSCGSPPGDAGDGGPAVRARLNVPTGVAVGQNGTVYISDTGNNRVRAVRPDGVIEALAGTGQAGFSGDGGSAATSELAGPYGLAYDKRFGLLIADSLNDRIRRVAIG